MMNLSKYYFLGTLLPDLKIGEKSEMPLAEFERLIQDNLSDSDFQKIRGIRTYFDIQNLKSYWKGEPFNPLGTLDQAELEEALVTQSILPEYIFAFLEKYQTKEERLKSFNELLRTYFKEEIVKAEGTVKANLVLERELRLVLAAFRAKQLGTDIVKEMQHEDPEEELIAQILAQKDAEQYEPPEKYLDVKDLLQQHEKDPIAMHKALLEYRFNKIEEMLGFDFFSLDRLAGFMVQLIMVEGWQLLDKQKGEEMVEKILRVGSAT